jgi:hypothetical protein
MKDYKAIAEKQKEYIQYLQSKISGYNSGYRSEKMIELEQELSALESQEINTEKGRPFDEPGCFNPECRKCEYQNSVNCNTCDILNPQFR